MSAMLMAAGLGTRLRPFSEITPKPLLPVMGIPTAQFAVDQLVYSGVSRIVANVHHRSLAATQGLTGLDLGRPGECEMLISDESDRLLGSAGGLRKALPLLGNKPFFLLNGDMLCELDLARLWTHHHALRSRWGVSLTLAVFRAGPPGGKYSEIQFDPESELITGIGPASEEKPFFVGAAVIEPEALERVPDGEPAEFVPLVLRPAIEQRKAGLFLDEGYWFDIGSPELWLNTHLSLMRRLEHGRLPALWRRRIEHFNTRLASEIWVGNDFRKAARAQVTNWAGPCYWSGMEGAGPAPSQLGPNAVVYGSLAAGAQPGSGPGIGYGGPWVDLSR